MPAPRFHPFVRLVICALGLVGVSIVLGLLLYMGSALSTPWTRQRPEDQLLDLTTRFALPLLVFSYPASLGWMAICRRKFDARSFVSLGLRPRRAGSDLVRGMTTGALAIGLLWLVLWLTGTISVAGWSQAALQNGILVSVATLLGYALAFFAVGFFEETLFRGYTLHNLNVWVGWRGAVAFQAILFALVHLGNVANADNESRRAAIGALPSLFLIAVFFALCYRKTGSLWFPIGFHFAWNFCLGCIFSLPVSGIETFRLLEVQLNDNSWFSGGSFGAEGSFFLLPILLALIYYVSRAPDHPQALLDLELMHHRAQFDAPSEIPSEVETEMPEEERESRYSTKFGTSQGFSADTLRELRDLQEARETAQKEAAENMRRETLANLSSAAPPSDLGTLASISSTSRDAFTTPHNDALVPANASTEPLDAVAQSPDASVATKSDEATLETIVAPAIKKKPPSPRW